MLADKISVPSFLIAVLLLMITMHFSSSVKKRAKASEKKREREKEKLIPKICWDFFPLIILGRNLEKYPGKINFLHLSEYSNLNVKTNAII